MSSPPEDIRELLPFWVNGTLTEEERAKVAAALAGSVELRADLAGIEALHRQMKAAPLPQGPGELGLARLMRVVDAEPRQSAPPHRQGGGRLAASVAVAAVLSSVLTLTLTRDRSGEGAVYEQASGEDLAATVTVTFRPEATEAAISALLRAKGLVIVDGPSAIGLYRIGLPYDLTAPDAASYLAAAAGVIATVDPVE